MSEKILRFSMLSSIWSMLVDIFFDGDSKKCIPGVCEKSVRGFVAAAENFRSVRIEGSKPLSACAV
jgi:hypothetical protein